MAEAHYTLAIHCGSDCANICHYVPVTQVADGLALVDLADTPHDDARWSVTHVDSGRAIVFACCEPKARRLARLLAELPVDWTRTMTLLRGEQDRIVDKMAEAGISNADVHHCADHPYGVLSC